MRANSIVGETNFLSNLNSVPEMMSPPDNYNKTAYVNKSGKKSIKLTKAKGSTQSFSLIVDTSEKVLGKRESVLTEGKESFKAILNETNNSNFISVSVPNMTSQRQEGGGIESTEDRKHENDTMMTAPNE